MGYETAIRLLIFLVILSAMAILEVFLPRRPETSRRRWIVNFSIVVIDVFLVRVLLPLGATGVAIVANERGIGLLNLISRDTLDTSVPVAFISGLLAFLALDLAIYFQHRIFHAVPLFWRLHRLHHSDTAFDFSTALRFHPLEILLSMIIKFAVIIALGAPGIVVMIFEIVLNGAALFNHANIRLPQRLDRILRFILVTPDMHRVHHSILPHETNSNFGFNIPWWDRAFGTYRDQPENGHEQMQIGLEEFRSGDDQRLDRLLLQPLR
ncbi:MAG: fatty acid hydroxylase [marine bacterium B5-7]|nr:MAG: fatty acid hydroxylase [marine bacterium B5-7]